MEGLLLGTFRTPRLVAESIQAKLRELAIAKKDPLELLEILLSQGPQRSSSGVTRYLVGGGSAVRFLTGKVRPHKDIDLMICEQGFNEATCLQFKLDCRVPEYNFGGMRLSKKFVTETAQSVRTRSAPLGQDALVLHPAILLVQKCAPFERNPPRPLDVEDAHALLVLCEKQAGNWSDIGDIAFASLGDRDCAQAQINLARIASKAQRRRG